MQSLILHYGCSMLSRRPTGSSSVLPFDVGRRFPFPPFPSTAIPLSFKYGRSVRGIFGPYAFPSVRSCSFLSFLFLPPQLGSCRNELLPTRATSECGDAFAALVFYSACFNIYFSLPVNYCVKCKYARGFSSLDWCPLSRRLSNFHPKLWTDLTAVGEIEMTRMLRERAP